VKFRTYDFLDVESIPNNHDAMIQALRTKGPLAVSVFVDAGWMAYSDGVYPCLTNGQVNHGVVLVGWNEEQNYYLIKK
jgi:C1A family cysteine protease